MFNPFEVPRPQLYPPLIMDEDLMDDEVMAFAREINPMVSDVRLRDVVEELKNRVYVDRHRAIRALVTNL
jgi:hypothetical protein